MLLALDIGNSTINAALFSGDDLIARLNVSSTVQRTGDETWNVIDSFLAPHLLIQGLAGVGISSVVPFQTTLFASLVREKIHKEALLISSALDLPIHILYENPSQLGPDRICTAVAGFTKHGAPLIIIDFGTATTFGVVDASGNFLGGAISLGVKSNAEALYRRTAQLPQIDLTLPQQAIGRDTISGMRSGTMFGAIDAVEGMVTRIRRELGSDAKVIATGGLSEVMSKQMPVIDTHEPTLALEGIRLIYDRNRK